MQLLARVSKHKSLKTYTYSGCSHYGSSSYVNYGSSFCGSCSNGYWERCNCSGGCNCFRGCNNPYDIDDGCVSCKVNVTVSIISAVVQQFKWLGGSSSQRHISFEKVIDLGFNDQTEIRTDEPDDFDKKK